MQNIYLGEFNEDDVLLNRDNYKKAIAAALETHGKGNIKTELIEYKGKAYYLRKIKVYLEKD